MNSSIAIVFCNKTDLRLKVQKYLMVYISPNGMVVLAWLCQNVDKSYVVVHVFACELQLGWSVV